LFWHLSRKPQIHCHRGEHEGTHGNKDLESIDSLHISMLGHPYLIVREGHKCSGENGDSAIEGTVIELDVIGHYE
jgi:hypothetical protein